MKETVHLQGIGPHLAKPAVELREGEEIVYNYGYRHVIDEIRDVSPEFLEITVLTDEGDPFTRRFKKARLVPFSTPGEVSPLSKWCNRCETYHRAGAHVR